jgi:methionyl-tRNA formyltransferase
MSININIILFAKGKRGYVCCKKVLEEGRNLSLIVRQPNDSFDEDILFLSDKFKVPSISFTDPNSKEALNTLSSYLPDLFILAGYGLILRSECLRIPRLYSINLHGGKLPYYRGSSPLNWALINNEKSVGISILKVDDGIDTGDILAESTRSLNLEDNISSLHDWANTEFPVMLSSVLKKIQHQEITPIPQNNLDAVYYPRRFPDDGFILWDKINAVDAHNLIRALSVPYPCAYTFFKGREIRIRSSSLPKSMFQGEPGRIYRKSKGKLLVGTILNALLIEDAYFVDDMTSLYDGVNRYDTLATLTEVAFDYYSNINENRKF